MFLSTLVSAGPCRSPGASYPGRSFRPTSRLSPHECAHYRALVTAGRRAIRCGAMGNVTEIEEAVRRLGEAELAKFREWFAEFDAARWDRQIDRDAAAGRLDALAEEALADVRDGRCKEL